VLNFSIEIGGFLAGISLSNLPEHNQIATRVRPLRDFFLTIFFVLLGTHLALAGDILPVILPALLLSAFVLIGNPIIVMSIMGVMGYKKRTSFMAGLTVAQISEFSLIIVTMGVALGHLRGYDMSVVTMVAVITMTLSTYMILGSDKVYRKLEPYLSVFERNNPKEKVFIKETQLRDHIVLVGCDRTGSSIIPYLKKLDVPFVVVDFNPKVYEKLTAKNHNVVFGDISDDEILEAASVDKAKMVISTTYNISDNLKLLESIKSFNNSPLTIFTTSRRAEGLKLYEHGANYIIVPDVLAGDYIRHVLRTYGLKGKRLRKAGKSHYKRLIFT
jgi:voltage-gated potassium channel Kch